MLAENSMFKTMQACPQQEAGKPKLTFLKQLLAHTLISQNPTYKVWFVWDHTWATLRHIGPKRARLFGITIEPA